MNAQLHPAWFDFKPGEQPSAREVCQSLDNLNENLTGIGSLLIDCANSDSDVSNTAARTGGILAQVAREIEALSEVYGRVAIRNEAENAGDDNPPVAAAKLDHVSLVAVEAYETVQAAKEIVDDAILLGWRPENQQKRAALLNGVRHLLESAEAKSRHVAHVLDVGVGAQS